MTVFRFYPSDAGLAAFDLEELAAELASTDATIERADHGRVRLLTPPASTTTRADLLVVVAAHTAVPQTLARAKLRKYAAINARTEELIDLGFEHPAASGDFFSLSASAQRKMNGAYGARTVMTYPIEVTTLGDASKVSLANVATYENWYHDAVAVVRGHVDSGGALKDQVRAAVDIAAVDAVVDNR